MCINNGKKCIEKKNIITKSFSNYKHCHECNKCTHKTFIHCPFCKYCIYKGSYSKHYFYCSSETLCKKENEIRRNTF